MLQYSRVLDHSLLLENRFTVFISGISMEIYLCHMVIFRVVEKLGLNTMFGNGLLQYVITVVLVLIGATIFAFVMQKLISFIEKKITGLRKKPA